MRRQNQTMLLVSLLLAATSADEWIRQPISGRLNQLHPEPFQSRYNLFSVLSSNRNIQQCQAFSSGRYFIYNEEKTHRLKFKGGVLRMGLKGSDWTVQVVSEKPPVLRLVSAQGYRIGASRFVKGGMDPFESMKMIWKGSPAQSEAQENFFVPYCDSNNRVYLNVLGSGFWLRDHNTDKEVEFTTDSAMVTPFVFQRRSFLRPASPNSVQDTLSTASHGSTRGEWS